MEKPRDYLLRGVPWELWREVRRYAAVHNCSIKLLIVRSLLHYMGLDDTDLGRSQAEIQKFEPTQPRNG